VTQLAAGAKTMNGAGLAKGAVVCGMLSACAQSPDNTSVAPHHSQAGSATSTPRALTTRPLLGTSTRNLLLDPFVTPDLSWGHFVGLLVPGMGTHPDVVTPKRAYVSQSPEGVAAPVASIGAIQAIDPGSTGVELLAPIPGGACSFDASVWVSAADPAGAPIDDASVTKAIGASLLPNDEPEHAYPLAKDKELVFGGRRWARLTLPNAVRMPRGGWFVIAITSRSISVELQAPEVVPAPPPEPSFAAIMALRTADDIAALRAYVDATRRAP
jgi:hypothetical protein